MEIDEEDGGGGEDGGGEQEQEQERVAQAIKNMFQSHVAFLRQRRAKRKASLALKSVVPCSSSENGTTAAGGGAVEKEDASVLDATGEGAVIHHILSKETDAFDGDGSLRTLQALLSVVDERGYARSPQQVRFHDSFIRACSRVLYKKDWASNRPTIMKANGWQKCPSEILISTPRYAQPFSASASPCY